MLSGVPWQYWKYQFAKASLPQGQADFDANGNLIYEGVADISIGQNDIGWVITKYVYTSATINGATIWQQTHFSTLSNVSWTLRTVYTFP